MILCGIVTVRLHIVIRAVVHINMLVKLFNKNLFFFPETMFTSTLDSLQNPLVTDYVWCISFVQRRFTAKL